MKFLSPLKIKTNLFLFCRENKSLSPDALDCLKVEKKTLNSKHSLVTMGFEQFQLSKDT